MLCINLWDYTDCIYLSCIFNLTVPLCIDSLMKVEKQRNVQLYQNKVLQLCSADSKRFEFLILFSRQVSPFHRPRRSLGRVEVQLYSILDLCTRRGEGSASRPGSNLPPGKTRYPLYRRLGGPQGRSGLVRKISPHRDSIAGPSSPQAVAIPTTLPGPQILFSSLFKNIPYFLAHKTHFFFPKNVT